MKDHRVEPHVLQYNIVVFSPSRSLIGVKDAVENTVPRYLNKVLIKSY